MWKHLVKIQNSQLSIDRMYPSINWNHEEDLNKLSTRLDRLLIPIWSIEKDHSIDRREFSIGQNLWNWIFQNFHQIVFNGIFMNKLPSYEHNRLSLRSKTEFHWCYSLKVQSNILNIKLKQHHNINISFYQTIISLTTQKINCRIF